MTRCSARVVLGVALGLAPGCGLGVLGTREEPARPPDAAPMPLPQDAAFEEALEAGSPCDDPSLVLCLRFEDAIVDEAHAQTIRVAGAPSFVPGKSGQAVLMDSTTTIHIDDNYFWRYQALTVETWLRPDALPNGGGRQGILDKDGSFGVFLYGDGKVGCIMQKTASDAILTVGQWVHVACVNDGATTLLYADGVERARIDSGLLDNNTSMVAVGGNSPSGEPLVGALDTFRVYARARTPIEIAAAARL